MKCSLDKYINKCPYFLQAEEECISKTKCSFQEKLIQKQVMNIFAKNVGMKSIIKNRKK